MHGRVAERAGFVAEVDACLVVQVQCADLEVGELGNPPAGVGDERGDRGGPQRVRALALMGLRTVRSCTRRSVSVGVR